MSTNRNDSSPLPRFPEGQIQRLGPAVVNLTPGEQVVVSAITDLKLDEHGHVWIDAGTEVTDVPLISPLTVLAERTSDGFILWIDTKVKLRPCKLSDLRQYLPVVEFRDKPGQED